MSYILKALKKVEEEKTARKGNAADMHTALMTDSGSKKASPSGSIRTAVTILALIAAAALIWKSMNRGGIPAGEVVSSGIPAAPAGVAERPRPVHSPAPAPVTAQAPAAAPVTAPEHSPASVSAPPAPVMPQTTETESPVSTDGLRKTGHVAAGKHPETQKPREPTGTAPAGLKVNGIAFQDDPAESMAVVNGKLVRRGMEIDGMRVDEIFRNRVRFSGRNGLFDLQLSK
jgi:general secretion pathway protein B